MSVHSRVDSRTYPKPLYAWFVVAVLCLALIFSYLDRYIITLLVGPIRRDLGIDETQMSLLMGFSFASFNAIAALPIARLADATNRRNIIAAGVATWSVMTALCGITQNYTQLFLARMGVGVGEAALTPPAWSMLSDLFPREKLPRALGTYSMGASIGAGSALMIGGVAIKFIETLPQYELPIVGSIYPWQLTFFIVGVPGLLVALLILAIREPERQGVFREGSREAEPHRTMPAKDVVKFVVVRWKTFGPLIGGSAVKQFLSYGTAIWAPTFFMRTYGWERAEVGLKYGFVVAVLAPIGYMLGGWLAGWLARRGYEDANMRAVFIASVCVIVPAILAPMMPTPEWALFMFALNMVFARMGAGPGQAVMQVISPNQIRAQIGSLYVLLLNFLGIGVAPTVLAMITQFYFGSDAAIGKSMILMAAVCAPIGSIVLFFGLKDYRRSVQLARQWNEEPLAVSAPSR